MKTLRTTLGVLGLSLAATACLDVPESATPECTKASDCDTTNGEVCESGVCWGTPPEGAFVAVITPPSDRNLVSKELTELVISEQGWLSGLQLEKPVTIAGDLDAVCTPPAVCDRGITATMEKFPGTQKRFLGGRNWLSLEPDAPDGLGRIWANWFAEGSQTEPYTKVIHPVTVSQT